MMVCAIKSSHVCFFPQGKKMLGVYADDSAAVAVVACPIAKNGEYGSLRVSAGTFNSKKGAISSIRSGGIKNKCLRALEKTYQSATGFALYVLPLISASEAERLTEQQIEKLCAKAHLVILEK